MLYLPHSASLSGKSSRNCAPRLSLRSSAARVMASERSADFGRSIAVCQPLLYCRCPAIPARSARVAKLLDDFERLLHFAFRAHDADQILHRVLQLVLDLIGILAGGAALEGLERGVRRSLNLRVVDRCGAIVFGEFGRILARALPNTSRSESEFPPSRLAPCSPAATSPAANRPGTVDICESPSTRTPPIM